MSIWTMPVVLPREAFSPRDAARAGDLWRLCQEVAIQGSRMVGWPPERYWRVGSAFIVRQMTVVHHREPAYGEPVTGKTWISQFRRGLLIHRQIEITGEQGPVCSTTQEWAHVSVGDGAMRPRRAPAELVDAFAVADGRPDIDLPEFTPGVGPTHTFRFRCWHTWMDPLGHANHPVYVDWCDEAVSVAMSQLGLDPLHLCPVAERVRWRRGVQGGDTVVITTHRAGRTAKGDVVFQHLVADEAGREFASATTVRRLADGGTEALAQL